MPVIIGIVVVIAVLFVLYVSYNAGKSRLRGFHEI
jgi:hypothetical protein